MKPGTIKKGRWIVTGINPLTRERDTLSRDLTYALAITIVKREKGKTRKRQTWEHLRAERIGPGQLRITFE